MEEKSNKETGNKSEGFKKSRRSFLFQITSAGLGFTVAPLLPLLHGNLLTKEEIKNNLSYPAEENITTNLTINGKKYSLDIDPRLTLLDALREKLLLFGTKKGCDHGQCGACTVLLNGRRINSCLCLAAVCEGEDVITIEGLANGDQLHPLQAAFIKHDAFQCGYCTPGQICSGVGLINEGHAETDNDIKELMSGNICRCAAYDNIHNAIKEVYTNHK